MEITKEEARMIQAGFKALDSASRSDEPSLSNSSPEFWVLEQKVREFLSTD